jgi:hypothetical protein
VTAPGRGRVVVAGLVTGLAVLGAASRTWLEANLAGMLTGSQQAAVPGSQAAPVVPALALVGLAAAAALSIAGRVGRVLVGVVLLLAGGVVAVAALDVRGRPAAAASAALAEQTAGIALGADQVTVTLWPVVTAVLGGLCSALGVLVLVAGRGWAGGRRFSPADDAQTPVPEPADDWDALTRGDDPTTRDPGTARE